MIPAFPKIFTLGQDYILDIFKEPVEVTEKIDGSQFDFGKINGEVVMRSKGKELFRDAPEKMFDKAMEYVISIGELIPDNTIFYAEYLRTPKHNVLVYERTPKNHLILFGMSNTGATFCDVSVLSAHAERLGIDYVPVLYKGMIESIDQLSKLLETDSILGKTKIEGVVCKNYYRQFLLGGQPIPLMMGKFVSEAFKEKHNKDWANENKSKNKWELYCEDFRSEARWQKAIQHLRDSGELQNAPQDIGKLLREIHVDIETEYKEEIKGFLWKEFSPELKRKAVAGFPEWYKEQLAKQSFEAKR